MNVFVKIFTGKNEVLLIPMKTSVIPSIFYHYFFSLYSSFVKTFTFTTPLPHPRPPFDS